MTIVCVRLWLKGKFGCPIRILVRNVFLYQGEQAVLKEGVITTGQVNVDDIIAWKKAFRV
ncbi:MAG: hypothetical protein ACLUDU_01585 [Butyricimonas faecihominis]